MELELDELELDNELDGLDELSLELELISSILTMENNELEPCEVRGPGNCSEPVWKLSKMGSDVAPPVRVSTSCACHRVLRVRTTDTSSTAPASASCAAAGAVSSPARR